MKSKLIFLLLLAFFVQTVNAQTKKGNFLLSGGAGLQFTSSHLKYVYDGESDGSETISSLSFMPTGAYFLIDNLAVGLNAAITTSTDKMEDGDKYVSTATMILPTAIYFFPMEGKIRPLAQVGIGLSSQSNKYVPKSGSDNKTSGSGLAINLGGGFAYFVKENISFNFGISYTMAKLTDSDDSKNKIKQGNFGSNIGIAVYF